MSYSVTGSNSVHFIVYMLRHSLINGPSSVLHMLHMLRHLWKKDFLVDLSCSPFILVKKKQPQNKKTSLLKSTEGLT